MVSCTEFIPFYSELFKYIEEKAGHDAVVRYWDEVRLKYVEDRLGECVRAKGIAGCWDYWTHSLNEEAADFRMEYDDEEQVFSIEMRDCPSRGMLNSLTQMEPYYDYCGHCDTLYRPILERYGYEGFADYSDVCHARCMLGFREKKTK